MKKSILLSSIILLGIFIALFLVISKRGKWDRYYENKMNHPPREIIIKALDLFRTPGRAIDIGCGVGNEAGYMLNNGWLVWAIDNEPRAIQLIQQRNDIDDTNNLIASVADFEDDAIWDTFPQADLINASCALPFCNKQQFKNVWMHIQQKLKSGGRFIGHFFGLEYQGFTDQEKEQMTFLTKEEVLQLFQDFDIEYFQETADDDLSGTGHATFSHIFEVIARKK